MYCNTGLPYCNILQYAFCHIVAPIVQPGFRGLVVLGFLRLGAVRVLELNSEVWVLELWGCQGSWSLVQLYFWAFLTSEFLCFGAVSGLRFGAVSSRELMQLESFRYEIRVLEICCSKDPWDLVKSGFLRFWCSQCYCGLVDSCCGRLRQSVSK